MQFLLPTLIWLTGVFGFFIGFTVMAAMWRAAEAENRNGWVIAVIWATATMIVLSAIHAANQMLASPHCLSTKPGTEHQAQSTRQMQEVHIPLGITSGWPLDLNLRID